MLYRNCIIRNAFGIALCSIMIGSQAFANVKEDSGKIMEPKEVQQQSIKISGIVSDDRGETIPGATVMIKGTTVGTTTDLNGEYSINVPNAKAVLEFRTIGYKPVEITVGTKRIINAVLYEDAQTLDEVAVVAFGKQKKESLTSSITTVKPAELKVPVSNLTTALAGSVAGMIAYQRSGEPGADNADFFVRGITTFGSNTNPLILIDGVELTSTDLARVQPDEIESFSIMKDATATALYGARGANGVILVTTKKGSTDGRTEISFNTYVGFQNRWNKPFKAENCFSVHDTFFRDQNRRTVPYLCKLLTGFNFGLCFIGKKNHELIFFGFCDYEKFAVFIFGYNRRFHIFQFV